MAGSIDPLPPITVTIVPEGTFPESQKVPSAIVISAGATVQFHAVTAQGTRGDQLVKWSVFAHTSQFPNRTISQSGLFQAPNAASELTVQGGQLAGLIQTYFGRLNVEIKP